MLAKKTLTKLSAVALLAATGLVATSAVAGTATVDNSKDKKAVIEQKPKEPKFYFSLGIGTDVDYRATPFSEETQSGATTIGTGNGLQRAGFKTPVYAEFDDYNSVGVEFGARLFFLPKEARLRPYVSIAGGATYVDQIDARFSLGDGTTIFDGGFYQGGVVATGSILTGVEFALTKNFSIGAEGGARYEFPLQQRDRELDTIGIGGGTGTTNNTTLSGINNAGDRFYLPFTVYGKVRF